MNSKLNEVAPGIFRLGNELFNWYLLKEGKQFTLIDTGLPRYWQQLVDTLKALDATVENISAILLTHAHLDHVGMATKAQQLSGAPIYLHPADRAMAKRGGAQIPPVGLLANVWRKHPFRMLTHAVGSNVFFGPSIKQFEALGSERTQLDVPGRPTMLFTPGHTSGSVSFWLPDRGALLAGDALVTVNLLSGKNFQPQLTPRNIGTDRAQSERSLVEFEDLGQAVLLTGHGDPWRGDMGQAVGLARDVVPDI